MIVGWEGREGRTKHLESAEASGLPPPRSDLLLPAAYYSKGAPTILRDRFDSTDGRCIARYAAHLDAHTGPGTATESLGRYVPGVFWNNRDVWMQSRTSINCCICLCFCSCCYRVPVGRDAPQPMLAPPGGTT
jgi:hypothetical protein